MIGALFFDRFDFFSLVFLGFLRVIAIAAVFMFLTVFRNHRHWRDAKVSFNIIFRIKRVIQHQLND